MSVENYISEVCLDDKIAQLRNGWFEVIRKVSKPKGTKVVGGLLLLKKEYPYQNQYLVNEFQEDFNLNKDIRIVHSDTSSNNQVRTSKGNYLCSLIFPEAEIDDTAGNTLIVSIFNLLGFILALLYLKAECTSLTKNMDLSFLLAFCRIVYSPSFPHDLRSFSGITLCNADFRSNFYGDASSFWLASLGDFFSERHYRILYHLVHMQNMFV